MIFILTGKKQTAMNSNVQWAVCWGTHPYIHTYLSGFGCVCVSNVVFIFYDKNSLHNFLLLRFKAIVFDVAIFYGRWRANMLRSRNCGACHVEHPQKVHWQKRGSKESKFF